MMSILWRPQSDQGESNVACSDVWGYSQGGNCAMSPSDCADYYACQFPAMIEVCENMHVAPFVGRPLLLMMNPDLVKTGSGQMYVRKVA